MRKIRSFPAEIADFFCKIRKILLKNLEVSKSIHIFAVDLLLYEQNVTTKSETTFRI